MRLWRRRRQSTPPVVLPSLDRLAGLIERVVELVDEVAGVPGGGSARAPEPARTGTPAPAPAAGAVPAEVASSGWVAFVSAPHGYALLDRTGPLPRPGERLELDGLPHRVLRHAPSPLPGDGRRCAFVEREEPQAADRSFDA